MRAAWQHEKFRTVLELASGEQKRLEQCANEWVLFLIDTNPLPGSENQCQLCNQQLIRQVLFIRNIVNGVVIRIGADCYEKLLNFLSTGNIKTTLEDRGEFVSGLKREWRKNLEDKTFIGWFKQQLDENTLPTDVAEAIRFAFANKMASSKEAGNLIVEYYKATKKFYRSVLLPDSNYYASSIPIMLTIKESEKFQHLMWLGERFDKAISERKLELLQEEAWSREWNATFAEVNEATRESGIRVDEWAKEKNPLAAFACDIHNRLCKEIHGLFDEGALELDLDSLIKRREKARELIQKAKDDVWYIPVEKEIGLVIADKADPTKRTVFARRNGRWIDLGSFNGKTPKPTGLYFIRVRKDLRRVSIGEEAPKDGITEVNFNMPSNKKVGTYVGSINGKIVVPERGSIFRRCKLKVFLTDDQGKYFRAIVL